MGNIITFAGVKTNEHVITKAIHRIVPAALIALCLWRIVGGVDPTLRFTDDFFYYVKAAENWVDGAGSTFFPGEPTNGYHPLWFLWLSLLYAITGRGPAFFAGVDVSVTILMLGFFFLFNRFLYQLTGRRLPAAVGAGVATMVIAPFAAWGLEMALTVCLAAALLMHLTRRPLAEQSVKYAAVAGLLCALMALARLDSIVLAPLLLIAIAPTWGLRRVMAAAAGAIPLAVYGAFNIAIYGHLSTTSMAAKSMRVYLPPNLHFLAVDVPIPGGAAMQLTIIEAVIIVLARRVQNRDARRIALALAAAPVIQMVLHATLSGWMRFGWYLYFDNMCLGVAAALVATELTRSASRTRRIGVPVGVLTAVALCVVVAGESRPAHVQVGISQAAHQLRDFAAQHPGVYAMGDAAGAPAWLMNQPVVHLEGLMMSHSFLKLIRDQRPLAVAFKRYGVSYYVAVRADGTDHAGCLVFREPNIRQSSALAPAMSMTICRPPDHEIMAGSYHMRIYRIDPATGLPD
ncbi:hypothetical protein FZI85_18090 [Mycobacterium sp. CBMA293]|uniref:hypothetical protein n=1 Tax=unclassified Mycolicibacterium TaxID=2636767 RepID=UPI0012DC1039|nr:MULTISPECIES: hypothetical protein [unclassified Mycolicibacterium]MUL44627.1 hypothetical protein [Mycolicibacterium sp. CBMA 360]MUL59951.1 hypothetical protein [Mycolicibacterium sp. CBMA 335]MUL68794.1 hypothetical protein [Mycolicibacterium sp. CBMA 311]MUL93815.1 hypothetical protein [Mycolicibacterium sp. CBMA 230]MUM06059.1 hypothetical protein [Mycolicibacterium sp. CBMA 213]